MSNHAHRWMLALLATSLTIGLSACGKDDKEDGSDKAATSSQQRSKPTTAKAAPAPVADDPTEPVRRFDMTQDGKQMTADEFDAWMDAQGVRVVKAGAAAAPDATVASAAPAADATVAKAAAPAPVSPAPAKE